MNAHELRAMAFAILTAVLLGKPAPVGNAISIEEGHTISVFWRDERNEEHRVMLSVADLQAIR